MLFRSPGRRSVALRTASGVDGSIPSRCTFTMGQCKLTLKLKCWVKSKTMLFNSEPRAGVAPWVSGNAQPETRCVSPKPKANLKKRKLNDVPTQRSLHAYGPSPRTRLVHMSPISQSSLPSWVQMASSTDVNVVGGGVRHAQDARPKSLSSAKDSQQWRPRDAFRRPKISADPGSERLTAISIAA